MRVRMRQPPTMNRAARMPDAAVLRREKSVNQVITRGTLFSASEKVFAMLPAVFLLLKCRKTAHRQKILQKI